MKSIVFSYKTKPAFGLLDEPSGKAVTVYDDGEVEYTRFNLNGKIISKETVTKIPGLALEVIAIINKHKDYLNDIPGNISNGSLDGTQEEFIFLDKEIVGWNLNRTDIDEVKANNPKYYENYKDDIEAENKLLDIFEEIVLLTNRYCIRNELLRIR